MNCSRDDIVLLPIPFTDLSSRKVRPAIVVGTGTFPGDLFVVPLTSQLGGASFTPADWRASGLKSGLNIPSAVKAQLATVKLSLGVKVVGRLTQRGRLTLHQHLRRWLGL